MLQTPPDSVLDLNTSKRSSTLRPKKGCCIPDRLLELWDDVCGQTGRTLQIRKKEHIRALTNSDAMTSALAEHAMDTIHKIAWEDTEVLASNPHPHQRCAIEAWHIRSQPLPMNREAGLLPLFTMD